MRDHLRKSLAGSVNLNDITFWGPYLLRLTPTKTMSLLFIAIRAWRSDSQSQLCEGYSITISYTSEYYRLPCPCICDYKLPPARGRIKVVWPHRKMREYDVPRTAVFRVNEYSD